MNRVWNGLLYENKVPFESWRCPTGPGSHDQGSHIWNMRENTCLSLSAFSPPPPISGRRVPLYKLGPDWGFFLLKRQFFSLVRLRFSSKARDHLECNRCCGKRVELVRNVTNSLATTPERLTLAFTPCLAPWGPEFPLVTGLLSIQQTLHSSLAEPRKGSAGFCGSFITRQSDVSMLHWHTRVFHFYLQ